MPLLDEMGRALPKANGPPALVEVNGAMGLDGANIGIDRPKGEAAAAAMPLLDEMGRAPPKTNGPPALVEVNGAKGLDGANIGID